MGRLPRISRSLAGKCTVLALLAVASAAILGQGCPGTAPPNPNSGLTGDFVGSERCLACHSQIHDTWAQTRHHESFNTLIALGQQTNEVCLQCHTTGFGQPGGFQSANTTELLTNVGCEACHGAARLHVQNVAEANLRPPVDITSNWCSQCHNGYHQDTYSEWSGSGHGTVVTDVANELVAGTVANSCGNCHSGDVLLAKGFSMSANISDALLQGKSVDQLNAQTCSVCHDPHMNTGNAVSPPKGHDLQLRWAEVTNPDPNNSNTATADPTRFNLCGQCHHDRGRDWTNTSRGPHPSVQSNFYLGEIPTPAGQAPLVASERSTHRFVQKQCVTCHMQSEAPIQDPLAGATTISPDLDAPDFVSHTWVVSTFGGCVASGCHPSEAVAQSDLQRLQNEVQTRLSGILARLGPVSVWGYSAEGGPSDQTTISTTIKQVRFLYEYVNVDGSLGVHNPPYTRSILTKAEQLLTSAGK